MEREGTNKEVLIRYLAGALVIFIKIWRRNLFYHCLQFADSGSDLQILLFLGLIAGRHMCKTLGIRFQTLAEILLHSSGCAVQTCSYIGKAWQGRDAVPKALSLAYYKNGVVWSIVQSDCTVHTAWAQCPAPCTGMTWHNRNRISATVME